VEQGTGPVTLRRKVGITLRALRAKAGITPQEAADCLYCHPSKISRLERGDAPLRERQVRALLDLYGVAAAEAESVLADVRATNRRPWWHQYQDAVPGWARGYLGMEAEASAIRCYAPYTVPPLFQTDSYADSLARLPSRSGQETARLREVRAERQAVVRGHGRILQAVIDEAALQRATGGPGVMREQCASLIQAAKEPGVSIRILRLSTGAHCDGGIPFTLLRFADSALDDVVYVETPATGIYAEKADDLDVYRELATRLELASEPASATPDILAGLW
jgi:transcriptional regulator with XRE-family HTH domain